jgi:hypothetical protein
LLVLPFGKRVDYRKWFVFPISILIAIVAAYWTVQRAFLI